MGIPAKSGVIIFASSIIPTAITVDLAISNWFCATALLTATRTPGTPLKEGEPIIVLNTEGATGAAIPSAAFPILIALTARFNAAVAESSEFRLTSAFVVAFMVIVAEAIAATVTAFANVTGACAPGGAPTICKSGLTASPIILIPVPALYAYAPSICIALSIIYEVFTDAVATAAAVK